LGRDFDILVRGQVGKEGDDQAAQVDLAFLDRQRLRDQDLLLLLHGFLDAPQHRRLATPADAGQHHQPV
jgi:hypothetical protein